MKTDYDALISQIAFRYELDGELLQAQVLVESGGQPDAFRYEPAFYTSYIRNNPKALAAKFGPLAACSCGLLQILVETAYEQGFKGQPHELFDPSVGLEWGVRYFRRLLTSANGDYTRALAAYNAGPGNLAGGAGYAQKVMTEARIWGEHGPH